jgi:hypothetical protein
LNLLLPILLSKGFAVRNQILKYKLSEFLILELIMIKHIVKGIAELIRHLLNLELFTVNLILNVINPEVEENITLHNLNY